MSSSAAVRKVWVRRPGASATLVAYNETDVVDDVREMLLRKYGNSLGRVYDAPDITLRLIPRETHEGERILGPDELMVRTLDVYYPGGQTIDEALLIDVPVRRSTPSASPRGGPPHASAYRDGHSANHGSAEQRTDYFGPSAVPEYYNHGATAGDSDYSSTLAPDSAYGRSSGAHHHYSSSSSHHHHHQHGHAHKTHLNLDLRTPPGSVGAASAALTSSAPPTSGGPGGSPLLHPHSMSIISTGQAPPIPNLPSPGGSRRSHKDRSDRPKLNRQISTTPDIDGSGSGHELSMQTSGGVLSAVPGSSMNLSFGQMGQSPHGPKVSIAAPISTSAGKLGGAGGGGSMKSKNAASSAGGAAVVDPGIDMNGQGSMANGKVGGSQSTALRNGVSPPRPMSPVRGKKQKKAVRQIEEERPEVVQLGPLTVPPINVLIVEDNIINLKLLEAFVKRLKVRWQTAMNGREAVTKWRSGGFHLVLMDIQLPLMSGLDATREIRRLERVNSIGVFASTPSDSIGVGRDPRSDKLANISLFKSPVIIVALTASSLQSDRNDALAAGCNDFLTKPVNFVWLEKKIMEWGCMQALIDFDGWRKWKELKLPAATDAPDGSGAADSTTKKSKKQAAHVKRPSVASLNHETGESSDTIATVSSADSPSAMRSPSRGANATSITGRSQLSQPAKSKRFTVNETAESSSSPDDISTSASIADEATAKA